MYTKCRYTRENHHSKLSCYLSLQENSHIPGTQDPKDLVQMDPLVFNLKEWHESQHLLGWTTPPGNSRIEGFFTESPSLKNMSKSWWWLESWAVNDSHHHIPKSTSSQQSASPWGIRIISPIAKQGDWTEKKAVFWNLSEWEEMAASKWRCWRILYQGVDGSSIRTGANCTIIKLIYI